MVFIEEDTESHISGNTTVAARQHDVVKDDNREDDGEEKDEDDEIPFNRFPLMEAFGNVDTSLCDSIMAFRILKVVFAVGKTLYTTSPGKLESKEWTEGHGREMSEWVRGIVAMFWGRFSEDFEIMEVI